MHRAMFVHSLHFIVCLRIRLMKDGNTTFFMKASSKCGFWRLGRMAGLCQIIPKGTKSPTSYFSFHRPLFDTMWDVSIHFHWFLITLFRGRVSFTLKAGRTLTWLWEEHVYSPVWCFKLIHTLPSSHTVKNGDCPCGYILFLSLTHTSYMSCHFPAFCLTFLNRKNNTVLIFDM